jgi:hypothetical protein
MGSSETVALASKKGLFEFGGQDIARLKTIRENLRDRDSHHTNCPWRGLSIGGGRTSYQAIDLVFI